MKRRYSARETREMLLGLADALGKLQDTAASVGLTPSARLLWLEEFVRRDLSDPAAREKASGELNVLLLHHYRAWGGDTNAAADIQQPIEPNTTVRVQQDVRALLDGISPKAVTRLATPVGDGLVWRPGRGVYFVSHEDRSQVLAAVAALLMEIGPRLRRCETPDCHKLFAAVRPHQIRCSTQCATRYRVAKSRREKRDQYLEARHAEYTRQVKTRQPKAKVQRRKRG